jgi:hypothetical protein
MELWTIWWSLAGRLRPAFARTRTFLWFVAALAATCVRADLAGVTSLVRALGLRTACYDRMLDMFHSRAVDLDALTRLWTRTVLGALRPFLLRDAAGRLVFPCDGIKAPKSGRKMPAVKKLHQESDGNTKPEYIFGHSCQAVAVAVRAGLAGTFALPLACRIHEGAVFSNRDRRTLLDKMAALALSLGVAEPAVLVGDAYYAAGKLIRRLLAAGWHLVTAAKSNAVAYLPPPPRRPGARGRPRAYGARVQLRSLFEDAGEFQKAPSPVYGESGVRLRYRCLDLLWKPAGRAVRFVLVEHPTRGRRILLSTDVAMPPVEVIRLYGVRFKIEVAFKQAVHTVGAFAYHFWMAAMKPRPRRSGDQYLHREPKPYRDGVVDGGVNMYQ